MKRFTLLSLFALLTICVQAYDFKYGDLYYNIIGDNNVEVTYQEQYVADNYPNLTFVLIPYSVVYNGTTYRVTGIGNGAFRDCSNLISVTIPDGVTSIGGSAFLGCGNLTSVTIPDGVTSIGNSAFYGCSSLDSITIPDGVTSIGDDAFWGCSNLTSVTIPDGVTSIGGSAFAFCSSLTSITIPNSVTSIGGSAFAGVPNVVYHGTATGSPWDAQSVNGYVDGYLIYADATKTTLLACSGAATGEIAIPSTVTSIGDFIFSWCSGITSAIIPNSVTSIGFQAFAGCTGLTSVTIPNSVTSIGYGAFSDCSRLTSVAIPNGVTELLGTFSGCSSLTSVTIPNSVTSIGYGAFSGCSGLTSVTIPNSVTSIGHEAFFGCNSLTSVAVPNKVTTIGIEAFYNCSSLTSLTIPNGVTFIGGRAFRGCSGLASVSISNNISTLEDSVFAYCTNLTSVTIPDGVTSIGNSAFYDCSSLDSIIIPEGVTSIGNSAFCKCSSLISVTIPEGVTSIGSYAFYGCRNLALVSIPNSVTSIGENAFYNVPKIAYWGTATGAPWGAKQMIFKDGYFLYTDATKTTLIRCDTEATGAITIPNSVTTILAYAFQYCDKISSVFIPNSVTSIEEGAFLHCIGLKSVTMSNSVTSIKDYTFTGCSITSITIPNSVTSIGYAAFHGCSGLTSITIPDRVTSIGSSAFADCGSLVSVTIGDSVTSIGDYAFSKCSELSEIIVSPNNIKYDSRNNCNAIIYTDTVILGCKNTIIPNTIRYIGVSAFDGCSGLTSINIPDSVTSIGAYAFRDCSGLTSIVIPINVTYVSSEAFDGCSSLKEVVWNAKRCSGATWYDTFHVSRPPYFVEYIAPPFRSMAKNITSFTFGAEVESIPNYLCYDMDKLTTITIPSSVTEVYSTSFEGCSELTKVIWKAKRCTFASCFSSNITSIVFDDEVEIIPSCICSGMDKLTSITIPNGVTSIGEKAFYGCCGLREFTIPDKVTEVGSCALDSCARLKKITCFAVEPPIVGGIAPHIVSPATTLFVPCGSVQRYMDSDAWKYFQRIECISDEPTNFTVTATPSDNSVTFEWPAYPNAATYTLYMKQEVGSGGTIEFIKIIFDNQGKADDGTEAKLIENSRFRYYLTGLVPKWKHNYSMEVGGGGTDSILCVYTDNFSVNDSKQVSETHIDHAAILKWNKKRAVEFYELVISSSSGKSQTYIFDENGIARGEYKNAELIDDGWCFEFCLTGLDAATRHHYSLSYLSDISNRFRIGGDNIDFTTAPASEMTIVPSTNSFIYTWSVNPLATSYEFTLLSDCMDVLCRKDVLYLCTFDSQGKFQENGKYKEATLSDGNFSCCIQGVEPSTKYYYTLQPKYKDNVLNTYSGSFVTLDASDAIQSVQDAGGTSAPRKVIRDGQVYIEHNGKTYSVMGTEVSNH